MKITFDLELHDNNRGNIDGIISRRKNEINSFFLNLINESELSKPKLTTSQTLNQVEGRPTSNEGSKAQEKTEKQSLFHSLVFQLPNGMVNREYSFTFNSGNSELNKIVLIDDDEFKESLHALGLTFVKENNQISGNPTKGGDFAIHFNYTTTEYPGKTFNQNGLFNLLINSDPRSMWKNIPTPDLIEYFKADQFWDFFKIHAGTDDTLYSKSIIAASKRGRSHAHEGKARDDDFSFRHDNNTGWYFIAVADGAGSAKVSRKGSEIACRTMVEVCRATLQGSDKIFEEFISDFNYEKTKEKRKKVEDALYKIIGSAVLRTLKDIEEEAISRSRSFKDYSTTLLFAMCKRFDFGWFVASFWIGDGGIGIYHKETTFLKVLGEPDSGEYAGQTRFLTPDILTSAEIYKRLRFEILNDFSALILMTDGITDPKFETDANLSDIKKWDELWEDLTKSVQFSSDFSNTSQQLLSWLDFWSPGNHDDRTIAILF